MPSRLMAQIRTGFRTADLGLPLGHRYGPGGPDFLTDCDNGVTANIRKRPPSARGSSTRSSATAMSTSLSGVASPRARLPNTIIRKRRHPYIAATRWENMPRARETDSVMPPGASTLHGIDDPMESVLVAVKLAKLHRSGPGELPANTPATSQHFEHTRMAVTDGNASRAASFKATTTNGVL